MALHLFEEMKAQQLKPNLASPYFKCVIHNFYALLILTNRSWCFVELTFIVLLHELFGSWQHLWSLWRHKLSILVQSLDSNFYPGYCSSVVKLSRVDFSWLLSIFCWCWFSIHHSYSLRLKIVVTFVGYSAPNKHTQSLSWWGNVIISLIVQYSSSRATHTWHKREIWVGCN
jgi:hypothetical protein